MRRLAIALIVLSPVLMAIGFGGCVASIASIGNSSRQMTLLEAGGLLGAPPLFILGIVLLVVDRFRRRAAQAGVREDGQAASEQPGRIARATRSFARIAVASALTGIGAGLGGLVLNGAVLVWGIDRLHLREMRLIAACAVVGVSAILICMPLIYAVLAWRESLKNRLRKALQSYEDRIMQTMEEVATDYVHSMAVGSTHPATLAASVRRVVNLPEPVQAVLLRIARRGGFRRALDVAIECASQNQTDRSTVVRAAANSLRSRLDETIFRPRQRYLLYAAAVNLLLLGFFVSMTRPSPGDLVRGAVEAAGAILVVAGLVVVVCLSPHPVAKSIRDCAKVLGTGIATVAFLILAGVTGVFLIGRGRPQRVRWAGCCLVEMVYGLILFGTAAWLCLGPCGDRKDIVILTACLAFVIPSVMLIAWIARSRPASQA